MLNNFIKPNFEFINHASYFINYKKLKILVDPWFSGSAFDNGWSLIINNMPNKNKILETTHIWFSHEHPDHFSVNDLKDIYKINPNIIILFQYTKDKRLINFCSKIGFKVNEIKNFKKIKLEPYFEIQIIKCGTLDSMSIMYFENKAIINLNDCVPNEDLFKLKDIIQIDKRQKILLTQFSYAEKSGNPDEPEKREKAVIRKLEQIKQQINFFKPDFIIPFASYIFFSNKDNFYLNDRTAKIEEVEKYINNNFKNTKPIILYPGEEWDFLIKENANSIKSYIEARKNIKVLFNDKVVSIEDIIKESKIYRKKIFIKNNKYLIFFIKFLSNLLRKDFFPEVIFFVKDLNKTIKFSLIANIKVIDGKSSNLDVQLNSHSFFYLLKYEWGASTLMINGKFIGCSKNGEFKIKRLFSLSLMNSTGKNLLSYIIERIFFKKQHKIDDNEASFIK
jgi:UDP-MurNAc hydroxylase